MNDLLHNPVYHALLTGDQQLSFGKDHVRYFDEEVSPFVGFDETYVQGFADLYEQMSSCRKILYATPSPITLPAGWQLQHEIKGLQFVYEKVRGSKKEFSNIIPLQEIHVEQMMELAALTKPGPFGPKTIDFGNYFGIFEKEKLLAMTGQRLHVENYTEISAVCTHPDHTGNGYAHSLLQHQLKLILQQGQQPFLHVRDNNQRAIDLYKRMDFAISRTMNFYFLKKQ